MRITGFFDERFEPPAPFIRTVLKSKNLGLSHRLHLHIDTGASVTIIFDKDIELLGINPEKLGESIYREIRIKCCVFCVINISRLYIDLLPPFSII